MVKQKMNQCNDAQRKEELGTAYETLDKEVKKSARNDAHTYTSPPTKAEVLNTTKVLKSGRAAGPDGIPPEALKTDAETTVADMLTPLLQNVTKEGRKGTF
ncbi:unnamed protein product [Heterobilharzia americana]|nr:unnamed protein product [Heterobilharzia americana]